MSKRAGKKSANTIYTLKKKFSWKLLVLIVCGVLLVGGGIYFWRSQKSLSRKDFDATYKIILNDIKEGNYKSADDRLGKLRRSGYGNDYRVLISSADTANYLKDIDTAKKYADQVLEQHKNNPLLLNREQFNRMEGYSSKIILPSPHEKPNYTVPKELENNADFQG